MDAVRYGVQVNLPRGAGGKVPVVGLAVPTPLDRVNLSAAPTPPLTPAPTPPIASAKPEAATPATPKPRDPNQKSWTFLFYINGNNFLSKQAPSLLRQLEFAGTDQHLNVVAQVARQKGTLDGISGDWSGVRRYEVPDTNKQLDQSEMASEMLRTLVPPYTRGINSVLKQDLGDEDMGSKDTLSDFVKWGMKNYPADHYCVVMLGPSSGMRGMMRDDTTGHQMSPADLKDAFANVEKSTGNKVDVLAFDASNATQAEMLYEFKDHVHYVVGSEGLVAGAGMSVPTVVFELKKGNQDRPRTPEEVAQTFTMVGSMAVSAAQFTPTVSAIDLTKMDGIKSSIDDLGKALVATATPREKLRNIMLNTQEVGMPGATTAYEGVKDVFHFAKLITKDKTITDPAVQTAAKSVMEAVDGSLVGEAHRGGPYKDANGISIFMPDNYGFIRPDGSPGRNWDHKFNYENLEFAKNSAWPQFLQSVAKDNFADRMATKLLGTNKVDSLVGFQRGLAPMVNSWSNLASSLGWWESFNVLQGGRPAKVLFIPPTVAVYAGAYGGVYDVYQGIKTGYNTFKSQKSMDVVVMNGLDVVGGVAKTAACLSLMHPNTVPLAYAAGMFGFLKPWIQQGYGYFMQYKQIRDSIALGDKEASSKAAVLTAQRMIGQHQYWDK